MRNNKKNPKKQIEKFSSIFTQLGLVLALFMVYISLEHQTEAKAAVAYHIPVNDEVYVFNNDEPMTFKKEITKKAKPKIKVPRITEKRSTNLSKIEKKEEINDVIENVILKNDELDKTKEIDINKVVEISEDSEIVEDVPYTAVQNKPVFKGCENLNENENSKCFERKMKKFVQRYFDTELANELGLSSGKKRIFVMFKIDKKGNITEVKSNATHPKLKKEAKRVINKLPKMEPGKQNGRPVSVKYTLPITFHVQ